VVKGAKKKTHIQRRESTERSNETTYKSSRKLEKDNTNTHTHDTHTYLCNINQREKVCPLIVDYVTVINLNTISKGTT